MDENRRLTSLFESARGEVSLLKAFCSSASASDSFFVCLEFGTQIEAIKEEFEAVRSEPALALGRLRLNAKSKESLKDNKDSDPTVGINVVCKGRREHLHFLLPVSQPLQHLFNTWSSRFPPSPPEPIPPASTPKRSQSHSRVPEPPIPPQSLGPPFVFTYAGKMLTGDETAENVGLEEGDTLVAIEIVDLARDAGKVEEEVVGNPLTKAAKKNLQAVRTQVDAVLEDV